MTSAEADVPDLTCVFDALPPARMKKYLDATGSQAGALELYRWNLSASTALWELICHAEVTLRHAVDIALSERHDRLKREGDWVFYAIEDKDGRAELGNCVEDLDTAYAKLCKKVGREPRFKDESAISADDVIAAVDFGFWKYLVAKDRENKLGTPIRRGFDYAPRGASSNDLNFLRQLVNPLHTVRNRIAHHEPICFLPGNYIRNKFDNAADLIGYFDKDLSRWAAAKSQIDAILAVKPPTRRRKG
ncbi:hypothetical protein [Prescottella equi]|uniref:hypothetical protein n=1 Tax=Rhodococcus hoagii TaxID=43767 RepID=UPI001EEC8182|nr:hypothetical protein [Prescottella equi]